MTYVKTADLTSEEEQQIRKLTNEVAELASRKLTDAEGNISTRDILKAAAACQSASDLMINFIVDQAKESAE